MLIVANSTVNSSQKVVTQIMLNQEETFRNQVYELHRLYQKRKIVMKEQRLKASYEFKFSEENPLSIVAPSSKHLKYESVATELELSQIPMMSSSRSITNHRPQMCRDLNDPQDFFGPSYGCNIPSKSSAKMKHHVHENRSSSMEGLDLSLRVGSNSYLEGVEQYQVNASCKSMSTKRKLFASHELGKLDLNKAAPDESYVHSNDHYIFNSSSSDISHNEVSEYGKATFFTVLDCNEPRYNFSNTNSTLTTSPSEDSGEKTHQKISISELNLETPSNQLLLEGSDSNKSPISCKSDLIKDDLSSNSNTGQCGINNSNPNSNVKSQSFDQKNEEFADLIMKRGARSLIYFSSSKDQDDFQEAKKLEQNRCSIEREVPQSSSESYEAIVLKQAESDEYCVSSTPYQESLLGEKDYHGRKFKRGRRMKDFRKEVLPNLASLDRDEICEDIQIMKLAIRSREYKKRRVKNATIPSARSRRSKFSNVGRKYHS